MDPNETLRIIRTQLTAWRSADQEGYDPDVLAETVEALNDWLAKGGWMPTPWAVGLLNKIQQDPAVQAAVQRNADELKERAGRMMPL